MSEVNKRQNGRAVLPECVGYGSTAAFLWLFAATALPKVEPRGCTPVKANLVLKPTLVSLNLALLGRNQRETIAMVSLWRFKGGGF